MFVFAGLLASRHVGLVNFAHLNLVVEHCGCITVPFLQSAHTQTVCYLARVDLILTASIYHGSSRLVEKVYDRVEFAGFFFIIFVSL